MESASVATAFARYDFPVPGGPYKRMPLHGFLFPAEMRHPCWLLHSATANTQVLVADSWRPKPARAGETERRTSEELRVLDRKDDGLLESILGCLQASNVVPL